MKRKNVIKYVLILKQKNVISCKNQRSAGGKSMIKNSYKINMSIIIDLSVDANGKPFIVGGCPLIGTTIESVNEHGGVLPPGLGVPSHRDCKERSKDLKQDQEPKDIAHLKCDAQNITRLTQPCRFDEFWGIYPRKQDKVKAKKAKPQYFSRFYAKDKLF